MLAKFQVRDAGQGIYDIQSIRRCQLRSFNLVPIMLFGVSRFLELLLLLSDEKILGECRPVVGKVSLN
jgi:hypothetical protein